MPHRLQAEVSQKNFPNIIDLNGEHRAPPTFFTAWPWKLQVRTQLWQVKIVIYIYMVYYDFIWFLIFLCFFVVVHVFWLCFSDCSLFFIIFFIFVYVFLLIASFPPEKHKSLLYKIRNPKTQPPPLSIKSDTPKNSSPPCLYKIRNPQKSTPPSIKSENVLSRLNLGPIQKHTKTYKNHVENHVKNNTFELINWMF